MKKTLGIVMAVALASIVATNVAAKPEKENAPRGKAVLTTLKELGEPHYVDRMKVHEMCSLEIGDTYFHVFTGELKKLGYHIIVYDNKKNYLGFYATEYEPTDYEEAAILLDSGDGENFYNIPIGSRGPSDTIRIDGMPIKFIKSPTNTGEAGGVAEKAAPVLVAATGEEGLTAEYREWIIIHKGKKIPVRAMYIEQKSGKVYLKAEANGVTKPFLISMLSKPDQAYVKKFK